MRELREFSDDCYYDGTRYVELAFAFIGVIALEILVFRLLRTSGAFYENVKVLADTSYRNLRITSLYRKQRLRLTMVGSSKVTPDGTQRSTSHCCCQCCCRCSYVCAEREDEIYGPHYFAMLANGTVFLFCDDVWCKKGALFFCFMLPRGLIEDYWLYVANNHNLFSIIFAVRGHPFTFCERACGFLLQNSLVFFFTGIVDASLERESSRYLMTLLVVAPTSMFLRKIYFYLTACPCIAEREKDGQCLIKLVACLGSLLAFPLVILAVALIFVGAIYGNLAYECGVYIDSHFQLIGETMYSTLLLSNIIDFIVPLLKVLDGRICIELNLLFFFKYRGLGLWYRQKIEVLGLQENVHYREFTFDLKLIKVIVRREMRGTMVEGSAVLGIEGSKTPVASVDLHEGVEEEAPDTSEEVLRAPEAV